jgi:hypothetical protein
MLRVATGVVVVAVMDKTPGVDACPVRRNTQVFLTLAQSVRDIPCPGYHGLGKVYNEAEESFVDNHQSSLIRNEPNRSLCDNDWVDQPGPIGPEGGSGGYGIGGSFGGGGGSGLGSGSSRLTCDIAAPTTDNDDGLSFISSLSSENSLLKIVLWRIVFYSS